MAQIQKYDLIIVGAGAAGLVAGMFATRRGLNTLILSKDLGGQASTTPDIENYPGQNLIEGLELMEKFAHQAKQFGAEILYEEVTKIEAQGEQYKVTTPHHDHITETIILAFGKTPMDLGVPGEDKFKGEHIHYAAMREAEAFKGKEVAMIGGGNTAVQGAIMLADVAKKVHLLVKEPQMRAEKILQDRLMERSDIVDIKYNISTKEFVGQDKLEEIVYDQNGTAGKISVDDAFIGIGYANKTEWVKELVAIDNMGQIIIQPDCSTSTPGIFAAGDITTIPYKQVIISAGEGAKAAIAANEYVAKKTGKIALKIDWGAQKP